MAVARTEYADSRDVLAFLQNQPSLDIADSLLCVHICESQVTSPVSLVRSGTW